MHLKRTEFLVSDAAQSTEEKMWKEAR